MIDFSGKQKEVWRNTIQQHHRWNISVGATRSGKTYLDYYKIPYRIRNVSNNGLILLLGNTKGTLERNILDPMRKIWTHGLVGEIGSDNKVELFGRECYALGADKVNQVSKLQGSGLSYCYGDEITTWHQDVFRMLQSRLDKPGSCFDGTCNPDNPGHWFKAFLDSDADIYQMHFTIDDNPFLDPSFVSSLKQEYSGTVYYARYIEGLWAAAEGVIYRQFADNPSAYVISKAPQDIIFATIGVDFGGNGSATAFNCTGFTEGFKNVVTLAEYYKKQIVSPAALERDFIEFVLLCKDQYQVTDIYCDSAEQTLIQGLKMACIKEKVAVNIHNARKKPINERIRFYSRLMGANRYKILDNCQKTIEAFCLAVWDPKHVTEDVRLDDGKYNIDSLDAQEYSTEPYMNQIMQIS